MLVTCFHASFLIGLVFDPEDGGDINFRKFGRLSADCTVFYPRRQDNFIATAVRISDSSRSMIEEISKNVNGRSM
jgi:hypothetical protein